MATHVWQIHNPAPAEQRRAERRAIAVSRATVRAQGELAEAAKLLDLSIYGCRLAAPDRHEEGDRLWLRFDGGWPVAATVVWADGERIGCRFDEPIAGSMMRELTRALI
jgi:hypothetical protein